MSIQSDWLEYFTQCYEGASAEQAEEMKRCFFAGALVACQSDSIKASEQECLSFLAQERDRLLRRHNMGLN